MSHALSIEFDRLHERMDQLSYAVELAKGTPNEDAARCALGAVILEAVEFLKHTGGWDPQGAVVQ